MIKTFHLQHSLDSTDDPFLLKHIVGVSLLLMTLVLIDIALLWRNNGVLNVVLATAVNNLIILNYLYYETKIYEDMTSEQNLSLDRCISVTALSLSLANFVKICVV